MLAGRKQQRVWLDFNRDEDISVPNIDGRIRIKALRIPKNVQLKKPSPKKEQPSAKFVQPPKT
jgi:hypothetical protein